ncbi:RNA 2',3'-cyclic phosphodiesterase [Parageobacillus sp. KH3-4]|uniref:RNA 2',3'-cyclic phosphodiesterase n=1 Tax=Parageobacillus sp. KH3-4 TaxID=2916802 RepID=UPI001FCAAA1C|nr:RNA 2',3'-cyclic phosphodiesterase [Parageobacillus sp. KH3-4]BDG46112.1 RNA 2',3'-cyclic phosphodiesterase [Parageobacillus sp. KH3-4]
MKKTHYFIAVPIADEVKKQIAEWKEGIASAFPFRTWVHQQDYHITLAFLGYVPPAKIDKICQIIGEVAKCHAPFALSLSEIQTFGNRTAPRILWQGVEKEEKLFALQRDVHAACIDIGFSLGKRPFTPHITIARKWQGNEVFCLNDLQMKPRVNATFPVGQIVLYQTHLDRTPKYEALALFPLSKNNF